MRCRYCCALPHYTVPRLSPQRDWAQPLLARIAEDRHHVVMPYIDGLSNDGKFTCVKYNSGRQ